MPERQACQTAKARMEHLEMTITEKAANGLRAYSTLNQGWEMTMTFGEPIRFTNARFGTLEIGMEPGGRYDLWNFHENGGGGIMAVGYVRKDDTIHIMMLRAPRFNLLGEHEDIEIPGGFLDGNEVALLGAARECIEETGIQPNLEAVAGRHYVGNRAFFRLDSESEGTKVFAFELTPEQAELIDADNRLVLLSWQEAVAQSRDALSIAAIARTVAALA